MGFPEADSPHFLSFLLPLGSKFRGLLPHSWHFAYVGHHPNLFPYNLVQLILIYLFCQLWLSCCHQLVLRRFCQTIIKIISWQFGYVFSYFHILLHLGGSAWGFQGLIPPHFLIFLHPLQSPDYKFCPPLWTIYLEEPAPPRNFRKLAPHFLFSFFCFFLSCI